MTVLDDGDEVLRLYLKEVASTHPLAVEEKATLARRIKTGDVNARDRRVRANLRFVIRIATEYQNQGLLLADIISVGNIGLITAAERYDGAIGNKFVSCAVWWIRQAIRQSLTDDSRIIRLPPNAVGMLRQVSHYTEDRRQVTSRDATREEIAGGLGISVGSLSDVLIKAQRPFSLDALLDEGKGASLLDTLPDESQESPDALVVENSLKEELKSALTSHREREREVIIRYFGLNGAAPMNLTEIASLYGLARERVRQIKEKALSELRPEMTTRRSGTASRTLRVRSSGLK